MQPVLVPALSRLHIAVVTLIIALAASPVFAQPALAKARVIAGGHSFIVDIADTFLVQAKGLGGRRHLGPSEGMLFVYSEKSRHTFWMKNMFIPIDIVWLDNERIVHIEHRVPPPAPNTPDTALRTYTPSQAANLVLEIAAGRAQELKLKVGDLVNYDFSGR